MIDDHDLEELRAIVQEHGIAYLLDHLGLDGYANEHLALVKALKAVEWVDLSGGFYAPECPWCGRDQDEGHKSDCPRQKALGYWNSRAVAERVAEGLGLVSKREAQ